MGPVSFTSADRPTDTQRTWMQDSATEGRLYHTLIGDLPDTQADQPSEDAPIDEIRFLRYRAPDVQAALTVLGRQPSMTRPKPLNLSDTDLRRADLSDADLQGQGCSGLGGREQTSEEHSCRG
jgi:hypothetical protein